tara:strand:- start:102 stop:221 length:120 start_codon:yes stop_codon:yes gene_type:complete
MVASPRVNFNLSPKYDSSTENSENIDNRTKVGVQSVVVT